VSSPTKQLKQICHIVGGTPTKEIDYKFPLAFLMLNMASLTRWVFSNPAGQPFP